MTRPFAKSARCRRVWLAFGVAMVTLLMVIPAARAATFSNPAAITINDNANATPYPSTINVSGVTGKLSDVNVTLTGLQHTAVQDIGVALVAPNGLGLEVMADVGFDLAPGVTYTFDDGAPVGLISPGGPLSRLGLLPLALPLHVHAEGSARRFATGHSGLPQRDRPERNLGAVRSRLRDGRFGVDRWRLEPRSDDGVAHGASHREARRGAEEVQEEEVEVQAGEVQEAREEAAGLIA